MARMQAARTEVMKAKEGRRERGGEERFNARTFSDFGHPVVERYGWKKKGQNGSSETEAARLCLREQVMWKKTQHTEKKKHKEHCKPFW